MRKVFAWLNKLCSDLIKLKMGNIKNAFLAWMLIITAILVSFSTVISTVFDYLTWQEAHAINIRVSDEWFEPDKQQPLVNLSGVRLAGTDNPFGKNITAAPGDIIDVYMTVRNVSGKPIDLKLLLSATKGGRKGERKAIE